MASPAAPASPGGFFRGHGHGHGSRSGSGSGSGHGRDENNPGPNPGSRTSPSPAPTKSIPQTLWDLQIPLHITHASYSSASPQPLSSSAAISSSSSSSPPHLRRPPPPFITSVPRFSYLAFLLPRLSAYFGGLPCSSFHHEDVQLRNLAVGLLVDLYRPPALPWRLVVGDGPEWDIGDTFMNAAKEADFVRNGNAKQIMGLSKEDTTALWAAVRDNDARGFAKVNGGLLNTSTPLRNVPVRIYIPSSSSSSSSSNTGPGEGRDVSTPGSTGAGAGAGASPVASGSFKVVQALVPPRTAANRGSTPQTLGAALRSALPSLFPSSRDPVLANVVLHGASAPFSAPLEELMREAAYPDGWLCLIVVLL